jgi:type I site-specific restriction endonuclease
MASKRNEQQTRFELIDPALETRGWLRSDIKVEVTAAQIDIIDGKTVRRLAEVELLPAALLRSAFCQQN